MKADLKQFSYFIDGSKEKDFDSFEKRMNKLDIKEVIVDTQKCELHAYTTKI